MYLNASLPEPPYGFQLFAALDVTSDTVRRHDPDTIRRDVTGTVTRQFEPMWGRFWGTWGNVNTNPVVQSMLPGWVQGMNEDGRNFIFVRSLLVAFDHYPTAWVNLDGDTLRVVLMETFREPIEEYEAVLRERNEQKGRLVADAEAGNVTMNDYRQLQGLPRTPVFETRLDPAMLQKFLSHPEWKSRTYNVII